MQRKEEMERNGGETEHRVTNRSEVEEKGKRWMRKKAGGLLIFSIRKWKRVKRRRGKVQRGVKERERDMDRGTYCHLLYHGKTCIMTRGKNKGCGAE